MIDDALIQQCADKALKPEIVEMFIERAGSQDPLGVTVRSGDRTILVPRPATPDDALALIRDNIGNNVVRVGVTQYPAWLANMEAGQLKPDLVEPCHNIRMGTAQFAKVYRIVTNWYGNPTNKEVLPQVLDDAIFAWQTGYFEGVAVFRVPGEAKMAESEPEQEGKVLYWSDHGTEGQQSKPSPLGEGGDPNGTGIRIDLSGIGVVKE